MFNWFDELKASIESGIKSGIEAGFKTTIEAIASGVQSLDQFWQVPEPAAPYEQIHAFTLNERPITQDCIVETGESWRIESYRERTVLLFEVTPPDVEECLLMCRAQMRSANLHKPAKLQLKGQNVAGWTFSRHIAIEGTTGWYACEVPFHFKKEQSTGNLFIAIEFEGGGVVWIKDLELLQAPVKKTVE
ncbi:unknown protein [Leptolyngbya sp. NIES-3755]|nr:unknown protein [Leptolyngbya sp. NIES-3755]